MVLMRMTWLKNTFKGIAYGILVILVSLCIYTFIMTDVLKKDYVNVFGYSYFVVSTGSMSGTIEVNDIIFVKITDDVEINDIVSYKNSDGSIITHRLVEKIGNKLITKGDVNNINDNPITKDQLVGKVKFILSPSLVLKSIAIFLILFIFLSLINFDKIIKKYIISDDSSSSGGEVPEGIFREKKKSKEEKSSGLTVNIPVEEVERINSIQERENYRDEAVEVLETEDIIDIDANNIVKKERSSAKEKEREILDLVVNLLRIKNKSLTITKINKKWLIKFQYVYRLAQILMLNDDISLLEAIEHPPFKEIYDYDLEKAGLYENLRNKIYDMPIYIFLKMLIFAVIYNDDEFFDGVYKILKYKVQIDKNGYFRTVAKNDTYARKQLKLLIDFMKKISLNYDNKNVFELDRIEKLVKLKNYANN